MVDDQMACDYPTSSNVHLVYICTLKWSFVGINIQELFLFKMNSSIENENEANNFKWVSKDF